MAPMTDPPADEGIFHYQYGDDVPAEVQKYWAQRDTIFSEYSRGIWMTNDAWFGITPEPVANAISEHVSDGAPKEKKIIIDAFAGAGGNAIAFALSGRWEQVFAIEKDPAVLKCAKHNAEIYGVEKKIWWYEGDCFEVLRTHLARTKDAIIYASPPWGGPGYREDNVFNLKTMEPYNLDTIYTAFAKVTKDIVLYLPRTSNLNQLVKYTTEGKKLEVAHYCLKGASKAICVYFGDFTFGPKDDDETIDETADGAAEGNGVSHLE
ncbi:putative RNA methylase family protein [Mytilinidion resinicola]|uniref:Trimethylguanosine synthase n=1 Tax=Mytilinidion resinicola TaxID=574789 RepID=A0A6A6YYT1_9PEZI|nr:putative RNA methylase family protein [Mytilinidion resinicola]KAF2813659.1 putative RNA methylase family protein [Mytilinidion resinicola]